MLLKISYFTLSISFSVFNNVIALQLVGSSTLVVMYFKMPISPHSKTVVYGLKALV
jgi:hypothetical protein